MEKKNKTKFSINSTITTVATIIALVVLVIIVFNYVLVKASNSNALLECKQAHEVILSQLLSADGSSDVEVTCDGVTFAYNNATGRVIYSGTPNTDDDGATLTKQMKEKFVDVGDLNGRFVIEDSNLIYITSNNKGRAIWRSNELPKIR